MSIADTTVAVSWPAAVVATAALLAVSVVCYFDHDTAKALGSVIMVIALAQSPKLVSRPVGSESP